MEISNSQALGQQVENNEVLPCCSEETKINIINLKRVVRISKKLKGKNKVIERISHEMSELMGKTEEYEQDIYKLQCKNQEKIKELEQRLSNSEIEYGSLLSQVSFESQNILKDLDDIYNDVKEIRKKLYKSPVFSISHIEINKVAVLVKSVKNKVLTFRKQNCITNSG